MRDKPKTLAQKSVAWQNRYLTPVLLAVGLVVVTASWAAGAIQWWIAVVALALITVSLVSVIKRNRP